MIDVVLCELEGVVAETSAPRRRALEHAFAEEGLDAGRFDAPPGLPVRAAIAQALARLSAASDATLVDLLAARAHRYFAAGAATGLTLAPGARDALVSLQVRTRLALVTRMPREAAERILSLAALDGMFEVVVTADDVIEEKPHPEGYLTAITRLTKRRPIRGGLAIEDGVTGVRAARAAGLPCIVVGSLPAHEALEADAMIGSLAGVTLDSLAALVSGGGARVA